MSVIEELQMLMRDIFDDSSIVISELTTADMIDGWDSLSHVGLIVAAEKAFGFRFNTTEIAQLENVGQFAEIIRQRTGRE